MKKDQLMNMSPIDGRYANADLQAIWSEYGLMHHRLLIEVRWLQTLSQQKTIRELPPFSMQINRYLHALIDRFSTQDALKIKNIERQTHHDLKAIEIFLAQRFEKQPPLKRAIEFLHFGCTSDDINNLAYALMIKTTRDEFVLPELKKIIRQLQSFARRYAQLPMLAHTHGQPATPTTLGKEFANVAVRLKEQVQILKDLNIKGKFNGATGNYSAASFAYPKINWENVNKQLVRKLKLDWNSHTTQIEPHDYIAELSHAMIRIDNILIDFSRDIWTYIALNYFSLKSNSKHVGSSTMPHKINPIQFENAEGNLGMANALFNHFANKLPISRMQRDLSDSTVMRNLGVAFAHHLVAQKSLITGLNLLKPNKKLLINELNSHWELLAEPLQTLMRRYGIKDAYEKIKKLTRGKTVTQQMLHEYVDRLDLPEKEKRRFKHLTPATYIGKAALLAKKV